MNIFKSPKLVLAAGLMFSAAAAWNTAAGHPPTIGGTSSLGIEKASQLQSSPTLPPDPWTEPARDVQSSPTLPPDPWTEPSCARV